MRKIQTLLSFLTLYLRSSRESVRLPTKVAPKRDRPSCMPEKISQPRSPCADTSIPR